MKGYAPVAARTATLTNTGVVMLTNVSAVLSDATAAFVTTVLPVNDNTLDPNATITFTIKPAADLPVGEYSATLTINAKDIIGQDIEGGSITRDVKFKVTAQPTVKANGGTGGGSYNVGETVTITATPPAGGTFTGWTVNRGNVTLANAQEATTTFTMPNEAVVVTANFSTPAPTPTPTPSPTPAPQNNSSEDKPQSKIPIIDLSNLKNPDDGKAQVANELKNLNPGLEAAGVIYITNEKMVINAGG